MPDLKIPFNSPPFPSVSEVELNEGVAQLFRNVFLNQAKHARSRRGLLPLGATVSAGVISGAMAAIATAPVDAVFETTPGVVIAVVDGDFYTMAQDGSKLGWTGQTAISGNPVYFAEDGEFVYAAHGGALLRLDVANRVAYAVGGNAPTTATHICCIRGFLILNGDSSAAYVQAQQLGSATFITSLLAISATYVLAGTATVAKVFASTDSGLTWNEIQTIGAETEVSSFSNLGASVILLGTYPNARIYRSGDNGATWSNFAQLVATPGTGARCLLSVTATGTVIAGTTGAVAKIYRSLDFGATWSDEGTLGASTSINALVEAANGDLLAAASGTGGVYVSADDGASWTLADTLVAAGTVWSLLRTSLDSIFAGGSDSKLYLSVDDGANFSQVAGTAFDGAVMALAERADGVLVAATTASIYHSEDDGVTWALEATLTPYSPQQQGLVAVGAADIAVATGGSSGFIYNSGGTAVGGDVAFSDDRINLYGAADSWEVFRNIQFPDTCTCVFELFGELYSGGPRSVEVSYAEDNPDNPWPKLQEAFIPHGVAAPYSLAKIFPSVYFLCYYKDAVRIVRLLNHQIEPVSSPYDAILKTLTLGDARGWAVCMDGLNFYVISFPSNNLTLAYNIDQEHWSEWTYWNSELGLHDRHLINSAVFVQSWKEMLIGDRRNAGLIHRVSNHPNDNGNAIVYENVTGFLDYGSSKAKFPGKINFKVLRGAVLDDSEPEFKVSWRKNAKGTFRPNRFLSLGAADDKKFYTPALAGVAKFKAIQFRVISDDPMSEFILVEAAFESLSEGQQ